MKFIVAFAAILAVASAAPQYLTSDFGSVVEGAKAVIAGPSGTISADTGAIVKSGLIAPRLIAPVAPRLIAPVAPRLIGAPLLHTPVIGARSFVGAPLLDRGLYTPSLFGARSLYGDYLL